MGLLREPLLKKRLVERRLNVAQIPPARAEAQLGVEVCALFGLTDAEVALLTA
jgi:hypothetical protein